MKVNGTLSLLAFTLATVSLSYQRNFYTSESYKGECQHDGYSQNQSCVCRQPFFSGQDCGTQKCVNDGYNPNDNRCLCPLGYLGQNCEAVRCVKGSENTFSMPKERVLAAYITYNKDFEQKIKKSNDDPVEAICKSWNSTQYDKVVFYLDIDSYWEEKDHENCYKNFHSYVGAFCDDTECTTNISLATVAEIVKQLPATSKLYIFGNIWPNNSTDSSLSSAVRIAISRRITINTIFYEPRGSLINSDDYNSIMNYRHLSEWTMGNYITPYFGHENTLVGNSSASEVVQFLEQIAVDGYGPATIGKVGVPCSVNLGIDEYYIIFRTNSSFGSKPIDFPGYKLVKNTGYWFVYSATGKNLSSLMLFSQELFTYYVYAKRRLEAYTSVTTSYEIDALSPYVMKNSTRLLVANIQWKGSDSNPLKTVAFFNANSGVIRSIQQRPNCQFSTVLGTVKCSEEKIFALIIQDSQTVSSVTPFMCSNFLTPEQDSHDDIKRDDVLLETKEDPNNADQRILVETSNNPKTLAIIAYNSKATTETLFVHPGNMIEHLVDFVSKNNKYERYYVNLFQDNPLSTKYANDISDYITLFMKQVHESNNSIGEAAFVSAIQDTLETFMYEDFSTFSDIIVFVDRNNTNTNVTALADLELVANKIRSRIYVVSYGLDKFTMSLSTTQNFRQLAERTGGFFVTVKNNDDLQKFYQSYFDLPYNLDVISQYIFERTISTNQSFTLSSNQDVFVIVQAEPGTMVSCTLDGGQVTPATALTGLWIYHNQSLPAGSHLLTTKVIPETIHHSTTIYTSQSSTPSTLAFTDNYETEFSSGGLEFGAEKPQIPIFSIKQMPNTSVRVDITLFDSNLTKVFNGILTERNFSQYNYYWDYQFTCSNKNDIYYFKTLTTFNDSVQESRIQTLTCAQKNECLHGGSYINEKCICNTGFVGENCEKRFCLNNGKLQENGFCRCVKNFTGDFCEINSEKCVDELNRPEIRSEIGTIIIVVQPGAITSTEDLGDLSYLTGKQIVVATCKNNTPILTKLSTSAADLKDSLIGTGTANNQDGQCIIEATLLAMRAQVSNRGFVVLSLNNINIDIAEETFKDIQNQFAASRYDLRIQFDSSNPLSPSLEKLSKLGNGLPYKGKFSEYAKKYLKFVFSDYGQSLVVVDSAYNQESSTKLTIDADITSKTKMIFVHQKFATVIVTQGNEPLNPTDERYEIDPAKQTTIQLTKSDNPYSYSIERISSSKLAYGFHSKSENQLLNLGSDENNNIVSFYTSNSLPFSTNNFPYVEISDLNDDSQVRIPATLRNGSDCVYPYFTDLSLVVDNYCAQNNAYKLKIVTFNAANSKYQEQKIIPCFKPTLDNCNHGKPGNTNCLCDDDWYGTDCSYPRCDKHTLYKSSLTCACEPEYCGKMCAEQSSMQKQELAFLIDVNGFGDRLYSIQINTIISYVSSFNMADMKITLVGTNYDFTKNISKKSTTYSDLHEFMNDLDKFTISRLKNDEEQDISSALLFILGEEKEQTLQIFAFSQMALTVNKTASDKLKTIGLKMSYFGLGTIYKPFIDDVKNLDDMRATASSGKINEIDSVDEGFSTMKFIIDIPVEQLPVKLPDIPPPTCINKMTANIYFGIEINNATDINYRLMLNEVISQFGEGFDLKPMTSLNTNITKYQWAGKSVITYFAYYDKYLNNPYRLSFCSTSSDNLKHLINTTKPNNAEPIWTKIIPPLSYYLNMPDCARFDDSTVDHIFIWMPLSSGSEVNDTLRGKAENSHYYHIIVHDETVTIDENSFYYKLVSNSLSRLNHPRNDSTISEQDFLLKWSKNDKATDIVQMLQKRLAKLFTDCSSPA